MTDTGEALSLRERYGLPPMVLAAHQWTDNAALIADAVYPLGYLHDDWVTLDATYGLGMWWTKRRPHDLRAHDRDPDKSPLEPVDFRDLSHLYRDRYFRAIAYDPPYISVGGRATSNIPDTYNRFGLMDAPTTPAGLQQQMDDGCTEMARLLDWSTPSRPTYLLYKCCDYVTNGAFWDGTGLSRDHARRLGLRVVDKFEYLGNPGAQPLRSKCLHCAKPILLRDDGAWWDMARSVDQSPKCPEVIDLFSDGQTVTDHAPTPGLIVQDHAARNLSTLYVFEKPKPPRRRAQHPALFDGVASDTSPTPQETP